MTGIFIDISSTSSFIMVSGAVMLQLKPSFFSFIEAKNIATGPIKVARIMVSNINIETHRYNPEVRVVKGEEITAPTTVFRLDFVSAC